MRGTGRCGACIRPLRRTRPQSSIVSMEEGILPYGIRVYPDPVLRRRAQLLDERRLKEEAPEIAARMIETG